MMALPYLACMALVASIYGLPPRLLPSIHAIEGGWVGSISRNSNGTEDLGVMQVNTVWLAPLARYTQLDPTVVRDKLIGDACFNIAAAGVILRTHLDETGDVMRAVGNYHSRTPSLHQSYRDKVVGAARRLFEPPPRVPR